MLDWKRFRAAIVSEMQPTELSNACSLAWSWLDLRAEHRSACVTACVGTEQAARWMLPALSLVRRRIWREAGVDPDDISQYTAFFERIGAGRASTDELNVMRRIDAASAITKDVTERFPAATASPEDRDQATLVASVPVLQAAIERTGMGLATPESLFKLRQAIDKFTMIASGFSGKTSRDWAWWMGLAWWAIGRGALELGRNGDARNGFERAATYYDQAGEVESAVDCRQRVSDLNSQLAADFDSAAEREVLSLLAPQEPLIRAQSLTRLLRTVGGTGDRFEAARIGEEAAHVLRDAGFPDPEPAFDAAVNEWITTAVAGCTGNTLLARLCEVAEYWAAIMGARTNNRLKSDVAGSGRAERTLRGIAALASELSLQANQARNESVLRFAVWDSKAASLLSEGHPFDASMQKMDALTILDDDLHRLRVACNEGASEAQLFQALVLRERAQDLGSRIHVAKAMIEHVYVLLAMHRDADVPALADLAVQTLLAGRTAHLGAFATGFERELYLTAINYKARALAAQRDHEGILAICEPVIRDIESERARVSCPYQQSAFLATRAEIYEFVAAAAYHTKRLDLLLAVTELLKARGALRSLLTPEVNVATDAIGDQIRQINDALIRAVPGSDDEFTLQERRRWLSTVHVIADARKGETPPEISVRGIQQVLAADEAAVSWFWIGADIAIVLAISREDVRTVVIKLDVSQQNMLHDYLACVTALTGDSRKYVRLIPHIAELVAALGSVLLPGEVRGLIADKARLVLSPHRTLHLFPFHAVPWQEGDATRYLIESFTIRYAPNLSSLLLAWHGNTEGRVLAVGVSHFDDPDNYPNLDNAEAEAAAVAAAHGANGVALTGATRQQFLAQSLSDYRCLHIATHGCSVLTGNIVDDPMQSCLYLRDGELTGWDIAALQLRAELVVLAACHSGQRSIAGRGLDILPGDDIFGLQAVLFDAGVGAVLGALWPVHDATALLILVDFHRAYAGGATPEESLRTAICAHLAGADRKRDVFYWASFFISAFGRKT